MSQVSTSFADSTYSASNKPSTTTLKADIQAIETALNDTDSTAVKLTGSQTVTEKIFTSPVINTQITGTAILDEDNMASDSAVKVPTQQSVKAYADTKVTSAAAVVAALSAVYPVGSIYISTVITNPATVFGFGTWTAFAEGRTLIGVGTSDAVYAAGATGGESTHALSVAELAVHNHQILIATTGSTQNCISQASQAGNYADTNVTNKYIKDSGSGTAHNNLPPYIVTYIFTRTA